MSGNAARVLVVEDEAIVAVDIREHLEHLGYEVVGTLDRGEDAVERLGRGGIDLALLDVQLKGEIDGIEAARSFQQQGVPVVFLTAFSDEATLERAKSVAPLGYVRKPFNERDLRVAVEVALYKAGLDEELRRSHEDLLAVLDALPQGVLLFDDGWRLGFANDAARRLLGPALEAATGTLVEEALGESLAAGVRRAGSSSGERLPLAWSTGGRELSLEIQVLPDPRSGSGSVVQLHDVSELRHLERQLEKQVHLGGMIGDSEALHGVFRWIRDVAPLAVPVLVCGETGTGKELVARAIHDLGPRRERPFVAVNCGGVNEELALSQLFGHRRGSFSGAVADHCGYFESATGGTLFLDEIGELSDRVQTLLLRVLEEGRIRRLGETRDREVDVRVLAATHRDLEEEIGAGRFRADLFYRLRAAEIVVPPLRERRSDIPLLAESFLERAQEAMGKTVAGLDEGALQALLAQDWPGNIRELRNAIDHGLIRARSDRILRQDLPPEMASDPVSGQASEADRIRAALLHADGNRKRAASILGISRATLYRRLRKYSID